ncbi:hypothetical protein Kpol_1057p9 [Vanderwaltozyma polyspora DSM 70294]|uniref:Uncharacterized protein n=1 Tax=Vanderwaltozyma polyspora (strain ATCC 22028 / DSM 70294 / BCRC 21397 / CBS 2163 / NBRC 10782 / NRRL Y-8283 / UCD 57-17) TaxID=436907 RepID=A7TPH7_VANPO|nr:uncharacterized protein Kpol_1057p9 [Vanderwaltozyma polyspora DSM 70294]EDO15821.1 hypothetical protein Kpol_1057p9 [Vanderwaltozyma polyspora DSM 70294]
MTGQYISNRLDWNSLGELSIFRDIKDELAKEQDKNNRNGLINGMKTERGGRKSGSRVCKSRDLCGGALPLAAYSVFEETPFYSRSCRGHRNGKFDVLYMREEQLKRNKNAIRYLGWNYIKVMGLNKTMCQLEEERKQRMQEVDAFDDINNARAVSVHNTPARPHLQEENVDEFGGGNSFQDLNIMANDELSEEDEISYDYDAEYARVEDDEGDYETNDGEHHGHRISSAIARATSEDSNQVQEETPSSRSDPNIQLNQNTVSRNNATRGLSIQQFVETSYIRNHPYESEDEYEYTNGDVDTNDDHDFTEVPSITISDTVQSADGQRISSLNNNGNNMSIEQFDRSINYQFTE